MKKSIKRIGAWELQHTYGLNEVGFYTIEYWNNKNHSVIYGFNKNTIDSDGDPIKFEKPPSKDVIGRWSFQVEAENGDVYIYPRNLKTRTALLKAMRKYMEKNK